VSGFLYLDSSAITKMVLAESESNALRQELAQWPDVVSSALAGIETRRAIARAEDPDGSLGEEAERVLASIPMLAITEKIAEAAARAQPDTLRTLDAIHLATIMSLGDRLAAVSVYDHRLADAVRAQGLSVLAPGAN
jgi:uncharacterized protein